MTISLTPVIVLYTGGLNMSKTYDVTFTIEERGTPDAKGHRAKVLIDNEGYLCGIFATYRHAKDAQPRIKRNLIREFKRRDSLKSTSN